MKRKKKLIPVALGLALLAIVASTILGLSARPSVTPDVARAATSQGAQPLEATPVTPAEDVTDLPRPVVISSADFAVIYKNVGQLREAADVIVRGEIVEISYLDFNSSAYTKVTFQVQKCFKGDIAPGEEITIAEVGGITTMAEVNGDKFGLPTPEDVDTKVRVELDGAPLAQVGDRCVYFLGVGSIGVVPGTYYVPLGAFQGRFKVESGVAKRFVPTDWEGSDYSELPMAETAIDETVGEAVVE